MSEQWLNVSDIITLMEAFQKNNMGALKLKHGECELSLKSREAPVMTAPVVAAPAAAPAAPAGAPAPETAGTAAEELSGTVISSPIVGTFYAAPAPDKAPFVQVGSKVKKGDVLFIIESMKLMNEVLCEQDGTVVKILAEDGQAMEYGQPVLCLA